MTKSKKEFKNIVYQSLKEKEGFFGNPGNVFNPFFDCIANAALKEIEGETAVMNISGRPAREVIDSGVLKQILIKVSKRVLIYDMNVRREAGELAGDSEEEEYADYVCHHLMQPEYVRNLFTEYPIWRDALFQSLKFYVRNIIEVFQHLASDKEDLNAGFFAENPFEEVLRISGSGSDSHCENRVVYRVELDNGEAIYHKSRVNTGVRFFNELYVRIGDSCGVPAYINPALERDDYVWEKEASYRECRSEQQVKNYFTRLGMILCICHLCHSGDMHYENMVACGEYPVLIDYETLIQLPPEQKPVDEKPTNVFIGMSVLPIGILPFYGARNKNFNADFSGLCGGGKQMMDLKIPVIADPGKSTMRIAYKYGETQEKNNRVRLNGELVDPGDYLHNIYEGFEAGYLYIYKHKAQVSQLAEMMSRSLYRQLFRNTQEYHMILDLSYHPQFMREDGMRREFLKNALSIIEFNDKSWIVDQEIEDMLKGDIPYFQFHMGSGEILNSRGKPLETFYKRTGMEFIGNQIQNRTLEDLRVQKQLIETALTYSRAAFLKTNISRFAAEDIKNISVENLCSKIADVVYEHRVELPGQIRWINTRTMAVNVDKRYTYYMEMSDRYLYEGIMGMAVFSAAMSKWKPEHQISGVYETIIKELFAYTDLTLENGTENLPTGIFFGESSIVYGYQLLYQITKEPVYLEYAAKHCRITAENLAFDNQFDIVGGNAGAIMAFLNMYDFRKESCYLEMAEAAAEELLKHAVSAETGIGWKSISNGALLGGFAHGCAGIMYSLARLARYTGKSRYRDAAFQAFLYEKTLYCPEKGGWRDLRADEELYMSDFKWCHGTAGILLGWKLSLPYFIGIQKEMLGREIERLTADYSNITCREEVGLCHGNLGNIMIGELAEMNVWEDSMRKNMMESLWVLQKLFMENETKAVLREHYDYSLMTGLAGVGYGLLRSLFPNLPGILDLQL